MGTCLIRKAEEEGSRLRLRLETKLVFWFIIAVICGFVVWTATGRLPWSYGNGNIGFDSSWDCPPNATAATTVCVKRVNPVK
jgi:hypothetical protein